MPQVKTLIDELVEEKMGSEKEVEKNNFKMVIEKFTAYIEIVVKDINDVLKTC